MYRSENQSRRSEGTEGKRGMAGIVLVIWLLFLTGVFFFCNRYQTEVNRWGGYNKESVEEYGQMQSLPEAEIGVIAAFSVITMGLVIRDAFDE